MLSNTSNEFTIPINGSNIADYELAIAKINGLQSYMFCYLNFYYLFNYYDSASIYNYDSYKAQQIKDFSSYL